MAQSTAKGSLTLTIDVDELRASLGFVPDPSGAEWTAEKVLRVLMDARIGGFNQRRAEDLVQKFGRAKAPLSEVVASGQAPEQPVPEAPEWCELPAPPGIAGLISSVALESPPPIVYKSRIETVKTEKMVKKAGALPFLPSKLEKVVSTERVEKKERVYPDPTVIRSGFAKKGERIGILSISKPGKQGKTIFGKPLQPVAEEGAFLLGAGVSRNRNELLAEYDGAVRMGERWVDVVPLPSHSWSLEPSADGATCFLNYTPGDPRLPAPSVDDILRKASELGLPPEGLIEASGIAAILAEANEGGEPVFSRSLSLDRDAYAEVKVSPDGLSATLSIYKGRGRGRPLELSAVSAAIKASGVKGLKAEQLKKDVIEFHRGSSPELVDYPLAQGRAPERGKDRVLTYALTFLPDEKVAELKAKIAASPSLAQAVPSLTEFPLEAVTKAAMVQLGQRIGELPPQQPGQGGVDVHGNALKGIPGNDPALKVFESIDFSKGSLTATANGVFLAGPVEGVLSLRVARLKDCSIEAGLSSDAQTAYLSLGAEEGLGTPLAVEGVLAALTAKGVAQGLEPWSIAEAVADARAGKPVLKRPVARAKPAIPPGGVKLEWIVKRASGALYSITSGDRADFREHDTMTRVAAGERILKIAETGGAGEDGIDVLGRPIKAAPLASADKVPEHDASIREEAGEEGSTILVASVGGELVAEEGRLYVRERIAIKGDVGPETGNLKFPGAVSVGGSVIAGFSLFATGDVSIGGAVEAALVSTDGSLHVSGGIKGARKGMIRARKSLDAAFAEQALILAVDDVRVRNACILCNVKTNGRLILTSDKGALIGGLCRARKGVEVTNLGSENYAKTEVSFGQDYLVADQVEAEEREIEKLKSLILQSDRTMAELEAAGAGLDRVREDKVKLLKLLEKRTMRVFELREKFEEHVASEVRVKGTVFPGVMLESHNRYFEVRSRKTKVVFAFDPQLGRIVERPL
jgi:uncharacterized protein (DUF342 family)